MVKWLRNTYNPHSSDAETMAVTPGPDQTQYEAYRDWLVWLTGKWIGEPQATEKHTVEELKAMNMVGVYGPDDSE